MTKNTHSPNMGPLQTDKKPTNRNATTDKTAGEILAEAGLLRKDTVAAWAGGEVFDLFTVPPRDARVEALSVEDPRALAVIRHSSAHVMADAVQRLFPGTQVTIGPAIDSGFYYDFDRPQGPFSDEELQQIENKMLEIIEEDLPFRRETIARKEAEELFETMGEHYKLDILARQQDPISVYRHGNWVDLCKGPHVPSTRFLRAVKLTSVAGAYWRGDERNKMLQRIYGTAFSSTKELRKHLAQLEEAKKRDHRKLGKELGLFSFHRLAPASPFFLPRGALIYRSLVDYVRGLYTQHDYQEVITPQVFDAELFRTSGHLPNYTDNMFFAATRDDIEHLRQTFAQEHHHDEDVAELEDEHQRLAARLFRYSVKPMNCPSHALIFGMQRRSYRELPMRIADFGRLHRYERSGVTQGLTRVRTFCQDDAHIFCRLDQIQDEIASFIDLVYQVYRDFQFTDVGLVIATRPDERLGKDTYWDEAEQALIEAASKKQIPYSIAEGEGAFYGPKIEFHLKDAIGRSWQMGTIQVDFNMAERFELDYVGQDNAVHQPVVLHRAILGSLERFYALLIEHTAGNFPTWLAPEQVMLLTISEKFNDFAVSVRQILENQGIRVAVDLSADKLGAKIRKGRLMRVPYLAVIGEKEQTSNELSIRSRDQNKDLGMLSVEQVAAMITTETERVFRQPDVFKKPSSPPAVKDS